MLSFELFFSDKSREVLSHVLSVKLDCQLDVPADSLTLTLPFAKKYREAVLAAAWEGDILRFYGPVDEVITVSQSGKHILRLYARSLAAFLLDNEAEPLTYANPSNKLMAERHLLPFGVTEYDNERHPLYDKAVFGENGVRYYSLRECRCPCRLISEIRVRLNAIGGYSSVMRNNNPDCAGRSRVRYLNATADNVNLDTARQMLEKGNREAYLLKLQCAGTRVDLLGMEAAVEDSGPGRIDGLRVTGVCCEMNEKGELTTVSLRKENV